MAGFQKFLTQERGKACLLDSLKLRLLFEVITSDFPLKDLANSNNFCHFLGQFKIEQKLKLAI